VRSFGVDGATFIVSFGERRYFGNLAAFQKEKVFPARKVLFQTAVLAASKLTTQLRKRTYSPVS
jgi:hypothetical protein